jgi:hypothetical protein
VLEPQMAGRYQLLQRAQGAAAIDLAFASPELTSRPLVLMVIGPVAQKKAPAHDKRVVTGP